jgi:hypothetical protein
MREQLAVMAAHLALGVIVLQRAEVVVVEQVLFLRQVVEAQVLAAQLILREAADKPDGAVLQIRRKQDAVGRRRWVGAQLHWRQTELWETGILAVITGVAGLAQQMEIVEALILAVLARLELSL